MGFTDFTSDSGLTRMSLLHLIGPAALTQTSAEQLGQDPILHLWVRSGA